MKIDTLTLRSAEFAVLFGPPINVTRQDAANIHAAVCDALSLDDLTFAYRTTPGAGGADAGFSVQLHRKVGTEVLQVVFDNSDRAKPMRLLISHAWPATVDELLANCDRIVDAVFGALGDTTRRVMVETRIRAHATAEGGSGSSYMNSELVVGAPDWIDSPTAPTACSLKYLWPSEQMEGDATQPPHRELQIEPLTANPGLLYLELVSRWVTNGSKSEPESLDAAPSAYIEESREFLGGTKRAAAAEPASRLRKTKKKRAVEPTVN